MNSDTESGHTKGARFFQARNESTRIDVFEELSYTAVAALRSFGRRLGAPHLIDEIVLPTLEEGDARVFAAVRDRPWPPWGVGARHVSALCLVQAIADESYSLSAVYVTDEDLTNVGLIAALYKEVLESLTVSERSEINYLAAEGSVLAARVLTSLGFRRYDDVLLTEEARYLTYRLSAQELLKRLGLEGVATPDLLAHDVPIDVLERNALFHQTIYLGSKAELTAGGRAGEIFRPPRGGHAGKPGGVPGGTGRFGWVVDPEESVLFFVTLENFMGELRPRLLEHVQARQADFRPSTVLLPGQSQPVVNEKMRRSKTLDDLGSFQARIAERIKESLQPVLERLGRKPFPLGRIEMQITASGDGDYFRMHRDTGQKDTRELAFVYFFHREPRRFSGGELRIFDAETIGGKVVPTDRSQLLSPRQDVVVFFPAENEHEILPVRVASREFADSRFTVNGWIHRA
jgi:hypothetical protein